MTSKKTYSADREIEYIKINHDKGEGEYIRIEHDKPQGYNDKEYENNTHEE
jgi:hypothetical protein